MMKKMIVLAVLLLGIPALAVNVEVTVEVTDTNEFTIGYTTDANLPRAFGLDVMIDSGTITGCTPTMTGESRTSAKGYGIFPGEFAQHLSSSDPNFDDPLYGPVADVTTYLEDTMDGIDSNGMTIELGSLYVGPNSPATSGDLCVVTVTDREACMTITENTIRGGVVMEESAQTPSLTLPADVCPCCMGDVSDPLNTGTPDGLVTLTDAIDLVQYLKDEGARMKILDTDAEYDAYKCGNISSAGSTYVPDNMINLTDAIDIVQMLKDHGSRMKITCPFDFPPE